jgi:hypothetical protein
MGSQTLSSEPTEDWEDGSEQSDSHESESDDVTLELPSSECWDESSEQTEPQDADAVGVMYAVGVMARL